MKPSHIFAGGLLSAALLCATGCHSHFVDAAVTNQSGGPIRLLEVDYPTASFGTEDLPSGKTFKYRFKILGDGPTKLTWTDAHEKDHNSAGPALHEGQEGSLSLTVGPAAAEWKTDLHP